MDAPTRTPPTDPRTPPPLPAVPPPTARRKGDGEKAVLACLGSGQQQCREIGRIIGRGASEVRRTMGKLVRIGAAVEVAPSCYAATAEAHALVDARAGSSRVILAFLAVPRRIGEIAQHTGAPRGTVRGRVDMLVCTGQAAKVDRGLYVATGRPRAMPDLPAAPPAAPSPWRARPIRDAILAFLVEPRRVQDVAAPIGRPVSNAASHLVAMQRRGLVVRTAHGRYERVEPMLDTGTAGRRGLGRVRARGHRRRCRRQPNHHQRRQHAAAARALAPRPVLSVVDKKGRVVSRLTSRDEDAMLAAFASSGATADARTRGAHVVRAAQQRDCWFHCDCLGPGTSAPVLVPVTETHIRRSPHHPPHADGCPFEMNEAEREGYAASLRELEPGESFQLARAIAQPGAALVRDAAAGLNDEDGESEDGQGAARGVHVARRQRSKLSQLLFKLLSDTRLHQVGRGPRGHTDQQATIHQAARGISLGGALMLSGVLSTDPGQLDDLLSHVRLRPCWPKIDNRTCWPSPERGRASSAAVIACAATKAVSLSGRMVH